MDDYISKPIEPIQLIQAIQRCAPTALPDDAPAPPEEAAEDPTPQPVAPTDGAALDLGILQQLHATLGDDAPKLLPKMVASYLEAAARLHSVMAEWRAQGQANALLRAAHTLKSNSELFGAPILATLYRDLEQHAKEGMLEAAEVLLPRIDDEQARVRAALDAILPTL